MEGYTYVVLPGVRVRGVGLGERGKALLNDVLRLRLIIFINEVPPHPYLITKYGRESNDTLAVSLL